MHLVSTKFSYSFIFILIICRWFDSADVHGTIMPRVTSIRKGVCRMPNGCLMPAGQAGGGEPEPIVCNGEHPGVQRRSIERAEKRRGVRVAYEARTKWWEELKVDENTDEDT